MTNQEKLKIANDILKRGKPKAKRKLTRKQIELKKRARAEAKAAKQA